MPSSDKPESVLVVDDDPKVRRLLRRCFESDGYAVREAADEQEVLRTVARAPLNLITLDINLGADNGLAVAQSVRRVSEVPIIMVTGKNDVIDRVVGLEMGADDYITKPFHVREVLARARSVLRRTQRGPAEMGAAAADTAHGYAFDGMTAVPDRLELRDRDGHIAEVTSGDLKLLFVFLENPKRILSREQIMNHLNGIEWSPLDRTIDNQVARLRKKIERDPARPALIKTVRGVGYMFAENVKTVEAGSVVTQ
ncbi:MAG: response regulator transcription factor [Pseudomonadota bacterium]